MPELLFYGGIVLIAAALLIGAVSAIVLSAAKKRLEKQLKAEFGNPRHEALASVKTGTFK